jgi:putative sigma-54 modulation protein
MLKTTIEGIRIDVGEDLEKYVIKKIGKLDKYIPRGARTSAHVQIFLKESKIKNKKQCTCEAVLHLPHDEFATKETTMNIFAAVDIVEAKLKNHMHKYKDTHATKPRIFNFQRHLKHKNTKSD